MAINKVRFYNLATEICQKKNIVRYLKIVAMNMSLDPNNIMLLFSQNKEMTTVCGKKAWDSFGRMIAPNATVYQISIPVFSRGEDGKCSFKYDFVGVIDAKSTGGDKFRPKPSPQKITDDLVSLTHRTIEEVPPTRMENAFEGAEYNEEHNVFYLSNRLNGKDRYSAIIKAYIKFDLAEMGFKDDLLANAVNYVVLMQYELDVMSIKGALFNELSQRTPAEQYEFLCNVVYASTDVMSKLNTAFFSFEETMLFNFICSFGIKEESHRKDELLHRLSEVERDINGDKGIKMAIQGLKYKLENCTEKDMDRLFDDIKKKKFLPTYPPFELKLANKQNNGGI